MTHGRNRIAWLHSSPPTEFRELAEGLGFLFVSPEEAQDDDALGQLLAIMLPTAALTSVATKAFVDACDRGVLCLVVAKSPDEFAAFSAILDEKATQSSHQLDFVRVIQDNPYQLLRACMGHQPGPSPNRSLVINPAEPPSTPCLLLKRAFSEFHRIDLESLEGGRSGGTVWRIDAFKNDGQPSEPFLAKIGDPRALQHERDAFEAWVRHRVPFPCQPPLIKSKCLRGAHTAILTSMFVTRAQRLDEYVKAVQAPELAIAGLFVGALKCWRAVKVAQRLPLGRMQVDQARSGMRGGVLPQESSLAEAHECAKQINPAVPSPDALYKQLSDLPAIAYGECLGHGDLNSRNAFVRASGLDVVLIDFSHVDRMPASRDPSRLEVSLAFDTGDRKIGFLRDDQLEQLYTAPLLPAASMETRDGRIAAIRQLRTQVGGEHVRSDEYELMTSCHLLRFARSVRGEGPNTAATVSPDDVRRLKARAYLCAALLVHHLQTNAAPGA